MRQPMTAPKADPTERAERDQTDESLQTERDNTDASVAHKEETAEALARQVLLLARERADQLLKTARSEASEGSRTAAEAARGEASVQRERSRADRVLQLEREERKRSHADFLAVERDATDRDLVEERKYADTIVAARDEFLAVVSHDLRGYLSALSLNTQAMGREAAAGALGDTVRRAVDTNRRLVTRMNRLINDLLDVSSIEAGTLAMVPGQVDIAVVLRETLDAFEPIAAAKPVTLVHKAETLHANVDSDRLLQVLANLVSNAIKFTPPGGTIVVGSRREGDLLHLEVADTGLGVPPDQLHSIFERFRQVSPDRRGVGLGLYISKKIVEAHRGRLWVESTLGSGSTFHVTLPAVF